MPDELPELLVADRARWRSWLGAHHQDQSGVWLVLAKKHVIEPTRLSYDEALEEALCHGWIDGQVRRRDERTFRQRFTPRRARSSWSQRNVGLVERLQAEGLMHPAGLAAVAAAKDDGRWDAAYAGQATIEIPADLTAALDVEPRAKAMFDRLSSQNRYAVLSGFTRPSAATPARGASRVSWRCWHAARPSIHRAKPSSSCADGGVRAGGASAAAACLAVSPKNASGRCIGV